MPGYSLTVYDEGVQSVIVSTGKAVGAPIELFGSTFISTTLRGDKITRRLSVDVRPASGEAMVYRYTNWTNQTDSTDGFADCGALQRTRRTVRTVRITGSVALLDDGWSARLAG